MDTVGNTDLSWYGSSTQWNETSTWRGCDMFRTYVLTSSENDDVGLYGDVYDISANSNVTGVNYTSLVGAVIQVEGRLNGVLTPYNHSVVVDAATSLNRNDIYCCAHNQIIKHNKLSEISLGSAKLIIPKYFRVEESTSNMLKGTLMPPQAQNTEGIQFF